MITTGAPRRAVTDDTESSVGERTSRAIRSDKRQKEALLKFTGRGIDNNLRDVLSLHPDLHIETTVSPDARYVLSTCRPPND